MAAASASSGQTQLDFQQVLFIETGTGCDGHGQSATVRASLH